MRRAKATKPRHSYTAKTLEAFSAKLRDETGPETPNNGLPRIIKETMQPSHASLWLRLTHHHVRAMDKSRSPTPTLHSSR
jgi:hypothetical protein